MILEAVDWINITFWTNISIQHFASEKVSEMRNNQEIVMFNKSTDHEDKAWKI